MAGNSSTGGGGMAANIAMGVMSLGSGYSAQASRTSATSLQSLNNYNAEVDEIRARDALRRGEIGEGRLRVDAKRLIGQQRAAFGASGVEVNDPDSTSVNVQADTAALSEIDALMIRSNAAREAWGFRAQAKDSRYRGEVAKAEGDQKAISTLFSTAGNVLYGRYGFGSTTRGRTGV